MLWNDRLEGLELLNEKALKSLGFFRSSGAVTLRSVEHVCIVESLCSRTTHAGWAPGGSDT